MLAPVFFRPNQTTHRAVRRVSAPFSRYEKFFCVVKICVAWHNGRRCNMGNAISHREMKIINI
ncbi:hypothetical protein C0Z18_00900 [Trinickia dabaoshanensis]|uniref:Uncharacterized protein n=1 Tax=Trinickia dabaoshanensis TaxID=564714 RepID=A0A2N7W2Y5_9BURK|nr:hypothetical protein C0Z18_00900 [Trinickia dabaoshanensis]